MGKNLKASSGAMIASLTNRNTMLVDKIKKLEQQLQVHAVLMEQASERAQSNRDRLMNIIQHAMRYQAHPDEPASLTFLERSVRPELSKILAEMSGQFWFPHGSRPTDFEKEVAAMFTQQHYTKLAELLKQQRAAVEAAPGISPTHKDAQHAVLNDFQLALMNFMEGDNPKFKKFRFIEAASNHAPPSE